MRNPCAVRPGCHVRHHREQFARRLSRCCFAERNNTQTGVYFKSYFKNPTRYELGTMVAILEIGAFSSFGRVHEIFANSSDVRSPVAHSDFAGCRTHRGSIWPQTNNFLGLSHFLSWRCYSNFCDKLRDHGLWAYHLWIRSWFPFVRLSHPISFIHIRKAKISRL